MLATHEQVLGGDTGQVYIGCGFPADPAYVSELARHGEAIGKLLASRGVVGRLSVDFAATQNDSGKWHIYALEINLRGGGTTHRTSSSATWFPAATIPMPGRGRRQTARGGGIGRQTTLVDESCSTRANTVIRAVAAEGLF